MIRNVSADLFRIVAAYRSTEETRAYLNGVYVQPHPCGGAYLVATDGHRMLVVYDRGAVCTEAAIIACPSDLLRAAKSKPARVRRGAGASAEATGPRFLQLVDGRATVRCEDAIVFEGADSGVIDSTFPDWQRIVPTLDAVPPAERSRAPAFNPSYLAGFGETARALADTLNTRATVRIVPCGAAAIVLFQGCDAAFGVLMPMHGHANDPAMPAFLNARPFAEPEITVTPVARSNVYGHDIDSWSFTVTTRRSELHLPQSERFVFSTEAAAKRAANALRKRLAKRGIRKLPPLYRPAVALSDAYLAEMKRRAEAVADARAAFAAVEDYELEAPWRRALVQRAVPALPSYESDTIRHAAFRAALSRLPGRSEAAALQSAYALAA
ncbi:hypothetical protein [Methylobacterium dankookense]|uniref:DNA polymerase III beta sliding clamp central domain-containing protein n=1 Tax=Methylobacterium dankookense TaxID=560405 RepID=A0A564G3V9_9HYPH|nr:hypothetical protein [Methylobacterium dankookense]GJD58696.1 hypothetical protein IFDJLNFL_4619 [Methylobacterium dankookense]VUF15175.1 hypothetical protein MTDSW087_04910 [Methylobacterium dankookense]